MKKLTEFILLNIIGENNYDVTEREEEGIIIIDVKVKSDMIGLVIGKAGNTIKAIQTLLRIKGKLENHMVNITVSEI